MRYYYLQVDENNNIINVVDTFYEQDGIALDRQEYEQTKLYKKFNIETRELSEPIEEPMQEPNRLDQIEEAIGALAEQVAKNTLLGGSL